jgi:hypothetical protein
MMAAAATPWNASAEESGAPPDVVARLVRHALNRATLDGELDLERREQRSLLLPKLRLGASLRRPVTPADATLWEVWALAGWPLDRRFGGDGKVGAVRADRRLELTERVTDLWRTRERLRRTLTDGDPFQKLEIDEIDAELEGLTGDEIDPMEGLR